MRRFIFRMPYAILVAFGIASCSHLPVKEIPLTANPSEEIQKLESNREQALSEQVDVLSPNYFKDASNYLTAAKESRAEGDGAEEILKYVAKGNAYLEKANEVAKVSRSTLGKVMERRSDAIAAGAPKFFASEFKDIEEDLRDATEEIEDQDLSDAEESRDSLMARYSDLELKTIREDKLGSAVATIESAINEGAKKDAPRTLEEAQKALKDAEAHIKANRHDEEGIRTRSEAATASANRVLNITRQAKVAEKKAGETLVLEREAQSDKLASESAAVERTEAELESARERAADLKSANERFASDQQFNAKLQTAKERFNPNEAEVLRDGGRLVIRMKGLAFPSGKSNLPSSSLSLLGKAHSVIGNLGDSLVSIEGHTDSTGRSANNKVLSLERANAIKEYFVSLGIPESDISTMGYGDSRPIAANNTKEGRAQNRRVDIIIEPKGTPAS